MIQLPDVDDFRARLLQDALNEATAAYWRRRALAFADAMTRAGDYPGRATAEQRAARDDVVAGIVRACLARAEISLLQTDPLPEVLAALKEVA